MTSSRDGVEIAYATHGAGGAGGPAVVLVHGWAGNRTYWAHQIDYLAERYQVIAIDLGGHGESGLGRDDWNLAGSATMSPRSSTTSAQPRSLSSGTRWVAMPLSTPRDGSVTAWSRWSGSTCCDRSATKRCPHPRRSRPSSRLPRDFAAAVDRFVRRLLPKTVDGRLVDRISADMAATPREVALGSLPYARNRQPAILAALPHITAPIAAINPATTPPDVASLRRHGVEPILVEDVVTSR